MRRATRFLLWTVSIVVGVPVLLVVLLLIGGNIGPGRLLIERAAEHFSGGMVRMTGLAGRFPDRLRLGHLDVNDAKGTWLRLDDVAIDWSPLALLGGTAHLDLVSAGHLVATRAPVPSTPAKPAPPAKAGGFGLPVRVVLDRLVIARADLGAALAGLPASLGIDGRATAIATDNATADIGITRLDGPGTYHVRAAVTPARIDADIDLAEPARGLIREFGHLPELGAITVAAKIAGPREAETVAVTIAAGNLRAAANGTVDLPGQSAKLDVTASAPAMAPRPDVKWQDVSLTAHVAGPFARPDITAQLTVDGVAAGGATLARLAADVSGNRGAVDLHAVLTGTVLPGPKPDLLAASPLDLTAHVQLDVPDRPVRFSLHHTLLTADGTAETGGDIAATVHVTVPDIGPLAAIGGVTLAGKTDATATMATHGQTTDMKVDGTASFTGGQVPVPALLGDTRFGVTASLAGQDITITRANVDGRALHASVTGSDKAAALDLAWQVALTDLSAVSAQAVGALTAHGTARGPQTGLAVVADITGEAGTAQVPKGPVSVHVDASGLPGTPAGTVTAQAMLDGSPLNLEAALDRGADGTLHALVRRGDWKSAHIETDLHLKPPATLPEGTVALRMTRLADLQKLVGQAVTGAVRANITLNPGPRPTAKIDFSGTGIGLGANSVEKLALSGTVADPVGAPDADLTLTADGIDAGGTTGNAKITARGPAGALVLRADAALANLGGADAHIATGATVNATAKQVTLATLAADYKGEALRLLGPTRIDAANGIAIDRLRLGLGAATLTVAGRLSPTLDVTASLRDVTPALAKPFDPTLDAEGQVSADARITGTPAAPQGTLTLTARGVRMRTGPAATLPAASLDTRVTLAGKSAAITAKLDAGPKLHLTANGTTPIAAGGAIDLRAAGGIDLTLLDPVLTAQGRRARGQLTLDSRVTGTPAAPSIAGSFSLAGGDIQDFAQGLHITDITARISADGQSVRIENFSGHAGDGTLAATGSIGVLAPTLPVDLHITASNAKPLASDLLTAVLDADITVKGQAAGEMDATGKITVRRADINIPDSFPPSVATLNVRRPGQKPPPAPGEAGASVRLALTLEAPRAIFVRGHGLDSELGGKLTIAGTSAAPDISGGFDMRRGDFNLAGTTLTFSKGRVGFDGTGVTRKIDPTLDFEADSTGGGITATLAITGYADAPKIALSSVPDLPQDEVLAHLLFGQSMKQLSAIQVAQIAAALAELSGAGGGANPLASIRKGLGLDRLSVGSDSSGTGASVEAGRYVAQGVYVGAKQDSSGGTQAQVQIDLTKRLKLQTTLGTGGGTTQGATPENDPGSTVGLAYQFEY